MSQTHAAITGIGVASSAGIGIDPLWESVCSGTSTIGPIEQFDASGFATSIAGEVRDFKIRNFVPKSYRKSTKVMARDIQLAVVAADAAVRDAGIETPGTDPDSEPDDDHIYPGARMGCHIGAGLIAADVEELTEAFVKAQNDDGSFNINTWGSEGMNHLTPLWLLKYLPNMLSCHVTILHHAQGPSNTITCAEASGALSLGESRRVLARGAADICFTGGGESRINPMGIQRMLLREVLSTTQNDQPLTSVKPFHTSSDGTIPGEGAGILMLENIEKATARDARIYAIVTGYAATTSPELDTRGLTSASDGQGIAAAIRYALENANLTPADIDCIVAKGTGAHQHDLPEAAAFRTVFGDQLSSLPIWSSKPFIGETGAASAAIDLALAAKMLHEQKLPAFINTKEPMPGLDVAPRPAADADLQHVLVTTSSLGGQNVAVVLSRHA